ncbi:hypothetical protein AVEN_35665-1 [Araneus ventricosus]|uniref:Uncharacterized protein n=1 Tax=Araneus ventricosus TaxID=182803 RepID=A0A4Y2GDJ7_ARAVE|nr:hypothetical protein AVEN_35665-1 [Araneus ventricosus]
MPSTNRSRTPALGDHFGDKFGDVGDKSRFPENGIIFSISLLGEENCIIPCDVTTSRARAYKRRPSKGGKDFGVSSAMRAGKPVS